jgi:hypothetical protein
MRDISRLGFVLLGINLVFSPLAGMSGYAVFATREASELLTPLLAALGFYGLFGLLPGVFLIVRNRALAAYLFPDAPDAILDTLAVLTSLVCVLGVYLCIRGITNAAGAVVSLVVLSRLSLEAVAQPVEGIVAALLLIVAGVFLAVRARTLAGYIYGSRR